MLGRNVNLTDDYRKFMEDISTHYTNADWESVAKALADAKQCCERAGFPNRTRCKQEVYGKYGGLERRYGRFENAATILEKALVLDEYDGDETLEHLLTSRIERTSNSLKEQDRTGAFEGSDSLERLQILGELGTVYRHMDEAEDAALAFELQYKLANRLVWQAEAEVCRSIGNIGMIKYQKALDEDHGSVTRAQLLDDAIYDNEDRVERAKSLRSKLPQIAGDKETEALDQKFRQWEVIGIARLALCYVAKQNISRALVYGHACMEAGKSLADPTSRAHVRFYYGYALWHDSQHDRARQLFDVHGPDDRDKCTPAIAFCKEPSSEHREYLRLLVETGARFDHRDGQGYNALDYAIFSGNQETEEIVSQGLMNRNLKVQARHTLAQVQEMKREGRLRKLYRILLQEHFRPAFGQASKTDPIKTVKVKYAQLLNENREMANSLDHLRFVKYSVFKALGRLPKSDDLEAVTSQSSESEDTQLVFMSYRWTGSSSEPKLDGPDDVHNTQYRRMCDAMEKLIETQGVKEDSLGLWLDVACIDQRNKDPGVASLPLFVAQCRYMISLVDSDAKHGYYSRAWCCSEVLLMQVLEKSYEHHQRFEHVLVDDRKSAFSGRLQQRDPDRELRPSEQKLSFESDRPKIEFLERQSRLLERKAERV